MSKKKIIYILTPIFLVLVCLCWYFLYFINTPSYAINKAREAYQKHDLVTFKRYVDTQAVMDAAFDDFLIAEDKLNGTNIFNNSFAAGIINLLKPTIVDLMQEELEKRVATDPSAPAAPSQKQVNPLDPLTKTMEQNIHRRFPDKSLSIKDLKITKQENGQAVCTIIVFNAKTNKNYNIELLMHINNKEDWQVYKTKNLVQFILETENDK